jgi:large subunit ribosomal protein L27
MAHKKAGSSSKNGRDSVGQRLGVKAGDGQLVTAGSIIVRQRGMTFIAGSGAGLGHDYTVFATVDGHVRFEHATKAKKRIRVLPIDGTAAAAPRTRQISKSRPKSSTAPASSESTATA